MRVQQRRQKDIGTRQIVAEPASDGGPARVLALDVGEKRIGLAVSDELALTALSLETYHRIRVRDDVAHIGRLAATHQAALVLLGLPLNLDGSEGPQAAYVRDFGRRLETRAGLRVAYWDERLSSVEASSILAAQPYGGRREKGDIDRVSAALLLQEYLDAQRAGGVE